MEISRQQILFYVIFILCIILITFYYTKYIKNTLYENFDNSKTNYLSAFNDSEIPNLSSKNAINTQLQSINTIFDKYKTLDPAITVNNNELICDSWVGYDTTDTSNPYDSTLNNCKVVEESGTGDKQCLSDNVLISCSNFFNDGIINKLTSIDLSIIKKNTRDKIIRNSNLLFKTIDKKSNEIDFVLNVLIDKLKLKEQQSYFIKYNNGNLNDKTKIVNKTTEEYEQNENNININQVNFSNFLSKNNTNIKKLNFYYNIIIGLIITIIVIGILNIFITDM